MGGCASCQTSMHCEDGFLERLRQMTRNETQKVLKAKERKIGHVRRLNLNKDLCEPDTSNRKTY